jgi:hypothetical protein
MKTNKASKQIKLLAILPIIFTIILLLFGIFIYLFSSDIIQKPAWLNNIIYKKTLNKTQISNALSNINIEMLNNDICEFVPRTTTPPFLRPPVNNNIINELWLEPNNCNNSIRAIRIVQASQYVNLSDKDSISIDTLSTPRFFFVQSYQSESSVLWNNIRYLYTFPYKLVPEYFNEYFANFKKIVSAEYSFYLSNNCISKKANENECKLFSENRKTGNIEQVWELNNAVNNIRVDYSNTGISPDSLALINYSNIQEYELILVPFNNPSNIVITKFSPNNKDYAKYLKTDTSY